MPNVTYVSSNTPKEIYLRSLSGEAVGISLSTGIITITGEWKKFLASNELIKLATKLNKVVAISVSNPIPSTTSKPRTLEGLKVDKTEISLVVGEEAELNITPLPEGIELPTQLICISDHLNSVSAVTDGCKIKVTAHKPGSATLKHISGNVQCETLVKVSVVPEFVKPYYEGLVGTPIKLAIKGQSKFNLSLPEGLIQEGNCVKSDKAGSYEVLCEVLGRTISTTVKITEK